MSIVVVTEEGIVRANVIRTPFFEQARSILLDGPFPEGVTSSSTVWVDYVVVRNRGNVLYVKIKKDKIEAHGNNTPPFTTRVFDKIRLLVS